MTMKTDLEHGDRLVSVTHTSNMATDPTPTPGTLVRFNHERKGGPVHRIASVARDGMIELEDMGGFFAPHLFEIAGDIADIPPTIPNRRDFLVMELRGLALRMQGRVEAIEDRDGKDGAVTGRGVGIGYLLARDLARTLSEAADFIEGE